MSYGGLAGRACVVAGGSVFYVPRPLFVGADGFAFCARRSPDDAWSEPEAVSIVVDPVGAPPPPPDRVYVDGAVDFDEFLSTNALSHEDLERLATLPDSRQSALLPQDALAKARAKSKAKRQPAYSPAGFLVDDAGDDGALDECRVFPTFRARGLA